MAHWVARLTNRAVLCSNPITDVLLLHSKISRCFLEQETLPLLYSTGWFQERI